MTTATTERRVLAVETDTKLAALHGEEAKLEQRLDWALDALHRAAGDDKQHRFSGPWKMTTAEVLAFDPSGLPEWGQRDFATKLAEYHEHEVALGNKRAEIASLNRVWSDNGRWHRYFLVNNNNGHVHRDQSCSTCYPTTQYLWLVDLADCDEREMVAEYGELACTVCFPDAPTYSGFGDGTSSIAKLSQAERDAKAAEKAAKAAAKEAKAIYQPDGQPCREADWRTREPGKGSVIKTERSASIALTDALWNATDYESSRDSYLAQAHYLAECLAHKQGKTIEEVLAEHEQKARKRK